MQTVDQETRLHRWYSSDESISTGVRVVGTYCGNPVVGRVTECRVSWASGVKASTIAVEEGYQPMLIGDEHVRRETVIVHHWIDGSPIYNGSDFLARIPDTWGH